jgi:hypothetical protein
MTAGANHAAHVLRHLDQLAKLHGDDRLGLLLEESGLVRMEKSLRTVAGTEVGGSACARYLEAVRRVFGDTSWSFARVNFTLAGCTELRKPG